MTALADALQALGWTVEFAPEREALRQRGVERLEGTVQIAFPDGDGELVIPSPRVPGELHQQGRGAAIPVVRLQRRVE